MIIKQTLVLFISLLFSLLFISKANATCEMTGDALNTSNGVGTPVNDVGDAGIGDACNYVPDTYQVEFYRMSLCTTNPDVAGEAQPDLSSCVDMLAETGATTQVNIVGTTETSLDVPDFTIPAGTYPYMVARLSARLGIKHAFEATTPVAWANGSVQDPGTYCWTVNNVLTGIDNRDGQITPFGTTVDAGNADQSNMQCSNTSSDVNNATFSYEVVYVNDDAGCASFDFNDGDRADAGNVGNGAAISRMMQSATTSATSCENTNSILWTIALTTPLVVTETSNFVMNFRTTDAVSIDFNGGASVNPLIVKVGADPIQAYLTVN
ncbi:hypothetical protein OAS34_02150 [Methylophilaceae bacterium]|nr:hypothetical protein [Methylophilaceae bacterium]